MVEACITSRLEGWGLGSFLDFLDGEGRGRPFGACLRLPTTPAAGVPGDCGRGNGGAAGPATADPLRLIPRW